MKNVRILIITMLHFLEIYIYKNTKNDHQCHSILSWVRNKIFKKWKKISWRYYHQIMIICFLVSEILTAMNGFFLCHFGSILLFCPNNGLKNQVPKIEKKAWRYYFTLCNKNHDMINVQFLRYRVWQKKVWRYYFTLA